LTSLQKRNINEVEASKPSGGFALLSRAIQVRTEGRNAWMEQLSGKVSQDVQTAGQGKKQTPLFYCIVNLLYDVLIPCIFKNILDNHIKWWHDEIRRSQYLGMG